MPPAMDDQGDHHCTAALRPPEIPKEPMEITTEEDRYAENEDLMSGNSFTLATSATSQLVLERIMSQSEVSPLASGRLSHSSGPLNDGQNSSSLTDSPQVTPSDMDDVKGLARLKIYNAFSSSRLQLAMVEIISKSMVKAQPPPQQLPADQKYHLTPWDLAMLSADYIQKGHLFANLPTTLSIETIVNNLKTSLSAALHHFYPLAGRLATEHEIDNDGKVTGMYVFIDCNNQGAEFIHADAHDLVSVEDVLAPSTSDIITALVPSLFPLDGAVNHDGHTFPLFAVQLTVLSDGVFLGFAYNHAVSDGISFWNFLNTWAEIARDVIPSRPTPILDRYLMMDFGAKPPLRLPFTHESQFIVRFHPPVPFREKVFHFSSEAMAKLKAKANEERGTSNISSFQSLSALMWRCITRARRIPAEQVTNCRVAIENRTRLRPALSPDYFGNSIYALCITATTGELLSNGLGWAAWLIHEGVVAHTDDVIRGMVRKWVEAPVVYNASMFDEFSVLMGSSPRFNMYGCDFGWGRAVALRSGTANKGDGKVSSYPGWEGCGSVDLEVTLATDSMAALEADPEFRDIVSQPVPLRDLLSKNING